MSTFDEQTDFSFLNVAEQPAPASNKSKQTGKGRSVQFNGISIGLIKDYSKRKRPSSATKAKISASLKGKVRSTETRAKMSTARTGSTMPKDAVEKMRSSKMKPLMTPLGPVLSRGEAGKIFDVDTTTIRNWLIKYPQHFYYITKD